METRAGFCLSLCPRPSPSFFHFLPPGDQARVRVPRSSGLCHLSVPPVSLPSLSRGVESGTRTPARVPDERCGSVIGVPGQAASQVCVLRSRCTCRSVGDEPLSVSLCLSVSLSLCLSVSVSKSLSSSLPPGAAWRRRPPSRDPSRLPRVPQPPALPSPSFLPSDPACLVLGQHLCSLGSVHLSLSQSLPVCPCLSLLPSDRPGLPGAWPTAVQLRSVHLSLSQSLPVCPGLSFLNLKGKILKEKECSPLLPSPVLPLFPTPEPTACPGLSQLRTESVSLSFWQNADTARPRPQPRLGPSPVVPEPVHPRTIRV